MKKYILVILVSMLSMGLSIAQPLADASIGGGFTPSHIAPGETSLLTVDIVADAFTTLPSGEVEVTISLPANGAYINNTDPAVGPTGTVASLFNWFYNAADKAWAGINNSPIIGGAFGGGGTVVFEVLGVMDPTQVVTDLEINYSNDSDDGNDHQQPDLIVPVELSSFFVKATECGKVFISWTTESEVNNDYFQVERKIDNNKFEAIGKVKGIEQAVDQRVYQYADKLNLKDGHTIYYRLKQVDRDGNFAYSDEIVTDYKCDNELQVDIYPNPAVDIINFEFNDAADGESLMLQVYDNTGKVALLIPNMDLDQQYTKSVDITSLPEGIYQLKITTNNMVINKNIIKVK